MKRATLGQFALLLVFVFACGIGELANGQQGAATDTGSDRIQAPADIGTALFYAVPGLSSASSFRTHADSIGVIAPQSFALDRWGQLRGSLPAEIAAIAHDHSVEIMPLVINADFSRGGAIRMLRSVGARDRAVGALVDQARGLGLAGWQIDFENLPSSQRAAFSRFVGKSVV